MLADYGGDRTACWVIKKALMGLNVGTEWISGSRLCNVDYADDIIFLETSHDRMQKVTEAVEVKGKEL